LWDNNEKPRDEWLFEYNAQIALLTTQIVWTDDVTRAFDELGAGSENAMKDCKTLIDERIESLIKQVRRTDLPILDRMKIINVITIDVHGRD
jgi:dynein heavy chain